MRPSKKVDYALRAAMDLAARTASGQLTPTSEIARRTGAPPKFLEAIVSELRRAGLVEARRGADGGLRLARPGDRISAGDIWRAMDGPLVFPPPLSRRRPAEGAARAVQNLWAKVDRAIEREVDSVSLEDLARSAQSLTPVQDFSI